jgi:cobalt-zinc-cadmium efflux system membrane fusion protein
MMQNNSQNQNPNENENRNLVHDPIPKPRPKHQMILIGLVLLLGIIGAIFILLPSAEPTHDEHGHDKDSHVSEQTQEHGESGHTNAEHTDSENSNSEKLATAAHSESEEGVTLTQAQLAAQDIQLAEAKSGTVSSMIRIPARLSVNTDQQAHVSAGFAGRVEQVYVHTGLMVTRGQALASLLVPELVDLQSNLNMLQAQLALAQQTYQREKQLWQQGISAQQDYLQAENALQQARITVDAAQSRLQAYGADRQSRGRFVVKSPMSGVISAKDLVVGESIQSTEQLFIIDNLQQLWVEFTVPDALLDSLQIGSPITVETSNANRQQARLTQLNPMADLQTGRLVARASLQNPQQRLKPNMPVFVQIQQIPAQAVNRQDLSTQPVMIRAEAVQQLGTQSVVFVADQSISQSNKPTDAIHFVAQPVQLGTKSTDQQWVQVLSGLKVGTRYAAVGSFILLSELQKGEAAHEH